MDPGNKIRKYIYIVFVTVNMLVIIFMDIFTIISFYLLFLAVLVNVGTKLN